MAKVQDDYLSSVVENPKFLPRGNLAQLQWESFSPFIARLKIGVLLDFCFSDKRHCLLLS